MNKAGRWKGRQKGKKKKKTKQDSRHPWPERAPAGSRAPLSTPTFPLPPRPENCSLCSHAAAHQLCHGRNWVSSGITGGAVPGGRPLTPWVCGSDPSQCARQPSHPRRACTPPRAARAQSPRPRSCPRGRVAPPRGPSPSGARHSPHPRSRPQRFLAHGPRWDSSQPPAPEPGSRGAGSP